VTVTLCYFDRVERMSLATKQNQKMTTVEIHPFGTIIKAASVEDAEQVAKGSLDDSFNKTKWQDLPHGRMLLEKRFGFEGKGWYAVATIYNS